MHKVITIDFWNTLYDSSNGKERAEARQKVIYNEIHRLGYSLNEQNISSAFKSMWNYFNSTWKTQERTPPLEELSNFFWNVLEISPDEQAEKALIEESKFGILKHPPKPMPGVKTALEELAREYSLAIISDTAFSPGSVLKEIIEKDELLEYFSAFSFSDETGVSKPHQMAYSKALEKFAVFPHECVHVGDIERTDIIGAKNYGMKAIRFEGDPNPIVNDGQSNETRADAQVYSWQEVVAVINSWKK